jgi:hypothetical protein
MAKKGMFGFVVMLVAGICSVLLNETFYLKPPMLKDETQFKRRISSKAKNKSKLKPFDEDRNKSSTESFMPTMKVEMSSFNHNDSQKSPRRFLLFTSAGDESNVNQWIRPERNYDIVVVYYGNATFQVDVDELYIRKDTKFPNLKWYMQTHSINKYKAIAVWDDDIVASVDSINALFLEMITTDADIFSPCHKRGSFSYLQKQQKGGVRDVRFIEMNAPMFLTWTLNDFMALFDPILKGWGTDIWYSYRCKYILDKCIMKVSDTTCVTNPKTRKDGTREINKAQPENVRLNTWVRFARDVLYQPSILPPKSDKIRAKVESFGIKTNTTGWKQFCEQNLKNNLTFAKYADKINVKKIVEKSKLNITIPKTYVAVTHAQNITLKMIQTLPNKYVFKASHGSAMTVIVNNNYLICHGYCVKRNYIGTNKTAQLEFLKRNCHKWLSIDFGKVHNERHYSVIHRRCFFEEMIPQNDDYKIHTFFGKPAIIEVHTDWNDKRRCQTFYTPSWYKINMVKTIPEPATVVEKPSRLREMLEIAKQLSRDIVFVRVDMYVNEQNIVCSELTMSPTACRTTFSPPVADKFYGSLATGSNQDPESIISLLT